MATHRELTFDDYPGILRRRRWTVAIPTILGAIAGFMLALYLPKKYVSHTAILVEQPVVPDSYVKPVVSEDLGQRLASMQEQILSRTRLQQLVEKFGLYAREANGRPMESLVEQLRKAIRVSPLNPMAGTRSPELPGFSVDVTMGDARLAQQVCREITAMFMEQNLRLRQQQAEDTTQFLAKQLEEAKGKLDDQDAKLAAFQRQHIGELPEDDKTNLSLLAGMTPQLEAATQALNQAQQEKAFTESLLTQQLATLQSRKGGQNPQTTDQQLQDLQSQLETLRGHYTEDHPDVVKLKNDIKQLQENLQDAAQQGHTQRKEPETVGARIEPLEVQQLRARLHQTDLAITHGAQEQQDLQRHIRVLQSRIQSSPMVQQEFKGLTRDYQTALNFYNDLLKKRNESQMATELERRQQGEQFHVLDPPSLPERPSFPKRSLFSIGGLSAGLALGAGMAWYGESRDKSMRTKHDVELYLGVPTLALIPSLERTRIEKNGLVRQMAAKGVELMTRTASSR